MEELRGGRSYPICIVCCYSFPSPSSNSPQEDPGEREKVVDKFIQQTGVEDLKCLSSEGLMASDQVSICEECLSVVAKAVEKREQVEEVEVTVRQLQMQILRMMRQLGELMEGYLEEMRDVETRISGGDEACLRSKFVSLGGKGEWTKENVLQFRVGIVNLVSKLSAFRTDLSRKTGGRSSPQINNQIDIFSFSSGNTGTTTVTDQNPIKVEIEDSEDFNLELRDELAISDNEWEYPKLTISSKCKSPRKPRKNRQSVKIVLLQKQDEPEVPTVCSSGRDNQHKESQVLDDVPVSNAFPKVFKKSNPAPSSVNTRGLRTRKKRRKQRQCPHCLKWVSQSGIKKHLQTHLPSEQRPTFKCADCGKVFKCLPTVKIHQARHCTAKSLSRESDIPVSDDVSNSDAIAEISKESNPSTSSLTNTPGQQTKRKRGKPKQCPHCLKWIAYAGIKSHMQTHLPVEQRPKFKCPDCGKLFQNQSTISLHQARHCSAKKPDWPFVCVHCSIRCSGSIELNRHLESVHGDTESTLKFPCTQCSRVFRAACLLKLHEVRHTPRQPKPLETLTASGEKRNQKCPDCGKLVGSKYLPLSVHQARFCSAKKPDWPFVCVHCSKRCSNARRLSRHVKSAHKDVESAPKFPCTQCDKVFHRENQLKKHQGVHRQPGAKSFVTCKLCNKLVHERYYPGHVASRCPANDPKTFVCHQCGKTLKSKVSLYTHLRVTCTENFNLECKLCGKGGFRNSKILRVHELRHENNATRPFMCSLCGGNFNCSNHLRRHSKKCDGTKKPRKPRWSNMLQVTQRKPEEGCSSVEAENSSENIN